jgi:hypothetical protein
MVRPLQEMLRLTLKMVHMTYAKHSLVQALSRH